jgi:hypothetical protein
MTTKKVLGLFAVGDEQFCGATAIELGWTREYISVKIITVKNIRRHNKTSSYHGDLSSGVFLPVLKIMAMDFVWVSNVVIENVTEWKSMLVKIMQEINN